MTHNLFDISTIKAKEFLELNQNIFDRERATVKITEILKYTLRKTDLTFRGKIKEQ